MKLYTKTICPKCVFVKSEITRLGLDVEVINIDQNEEAKELVIAQGIMAAPALEVDGKWFADHTQILTVLNEIAE